MRKIMAIALLIITAMVAGCGSPDDAAIGVCKDYLRMCEKMDNGATVDESTFLQYFDKNNGASMTEGSASWEAMVGRQFKLQQLGITVSYEISDPTAVKRTEGTVPGYEVYEVSMTVDIKISDGSRNLSRYFFIVASQPGKGDWKIMQEMHKRMG